MAETRSGFLDDDLVQVKVEGDGETIVLAWGDPVEVVATEGKKTRVRVRDRQGRTVEGTVAHRLSKLRDSGVLQLAMVDVQQGDGLVLQTPSGKVLFIDGGDNKMFARYGAARFLGTSDSRPQELEAMIITHGDADHFAGLNEIVASESHNTRRKRLFLRVKRVFHNGLVKGPSKLKDEEIFGQTVTTNQGTFVTDLVDDLTKVEASRMNAPFKRWQKSLEHWVRRGEIEFRRLAAGDTEAFEFLKKTDGMAVEVLGPIAERVKANGKTVDALPLLHEPPKAVAFSEEESGGAFSASHTINGHSVVLRVTFGSVRMLLSGDLNHESMKRLRQKMGADKLASEVVKVPHHGSADFEPNALEEMGAVVWLISSGDESSKKEYIHPRATLLGALGRSSRQGVPTPLVFCTELAAFFALRGPSQTVDGKTRYFGFERTNFGIIHVRTDGERVLVFTHSGRSELKEAYRFRVSADHKVTFEEVVKK